MPAVIVTRFNAGMKAKYQALVAAGNLDKVALTAIKRRLLIIGNALLRANPAVRPKDSLTTTDALAGNHYMRGPGL